MILRRARVVSAGLLMLAAGRAVAQTPDSTATETVGTCLLEWGAPPDGTAPALRHTEDESGETADFFSGRTLFTCGSAIMLADSAVSYQNRGEVYLVGNVDYQDSLRTLKSTYLTYFERADLVVADDNVRLVRIADRSTLEGPHVEFLRAVSGVDELTTATGRPHMTLYPGGDDPGPPFEVDADRTVFAGEDEARAYGNVVIDRDDLKGEADSIRLQRAAETGEMWGDPWIEAEGVRLEGDMIHFRSTDDVVEEIHAVGNGRAIGESFEVTSTIIDIRLADEQPERVWAHGAGLSRALSGAHNVYGDSLEFAMFEGAIDTMFAVGDAIAVQGEAETADSALTLPADSAVALPPDSVVIEVPADSAVALPPDSVVIETPATDSVGLSPPGVASDSVPPSPPDSTVVGEEADEAFDPAAGGSVRAPRLGVAGAATWIRGDTLIAVFVRAGAQGPPAEAAAGTGLVAPLPADTVVAENPTVAEGALVSVDSLVLIEPAPAVADSAADPVMERLIAIGSARSLFSQVRDSLQSDRESKNYMIGKRIELVFRDGEPATVTGVEAIGIFLDPEAAGAPAAPPAPLPADSLGVPVTALPDSTGLPPDTSGVGRDTIAVSLRAPHPAPASRTAPQSGFSGGSRDPALRQRRTTWWLH